MWALIDQAVAAGAVKKILRRFGRADSPPCITAAAMQGGECATRTHFDIFHSSPDRAYFLESGIRAVTDRASVQRLTAQRSNSQPLLTSAQQTEYAPYMRGLDHH